MHLVESSISWSDTYASAVARLPELVRTAPPVLGASSANVDHIYYVDSERFAALTPTSASRAARSRAPRSRATRAVTFAFAPTRHPIPRSSSSSARAASP